MDDNYYTEQPLGLHLSLLAKAYVGAISKKLEDLPLDRYFYFIAFIGERENEEKVTQQTICEALNIDKASMVRVIDELIGKGLVKKDVNPADRREHLLNLTEKAREMVPDIQSAIKEVNEKAFQGFTNQEIEAFYHSLYTICNNISAMPSHVVELEMNKVSKTFNSNEHS